MINSMLIAESNEIWVELSELESSVDERERELIDRNDALAEARRKLHRDVVELQQQIDDSDDELDVLNAKLEALSVATEHKDLASKAIIELRADIVKQRDAVCDSVDDALSSFQRNLEEQREALGLLQRELAERQTVASNLSESLRAAATDCDETDETEAVVEVDTAEDSDEDSGTDNVEMLNPVEVKREEMIELNVHLALDSEDNFYDELDSKKIGVFASTAELLPVGESVRLNVQVEGGKLLQAEGRVRWLREFNDDTPLLHPGMGIELAWVDDRDRAIIDSFMAQREPWLYAA